MDWLLLSTTASVIQLHRANEGAASARAVSAFNYNICTGPAWEHRAHLPTQHRGHASAAIPHHQHEEPREAPERGQEGDTFRSVGTHSGAWGQLLVCPVKADVEVWHEQYLSAGPPGLT